RASAWTCSGGRPGHSRCGAPSCSLWLSREAESESRNRLGSLVTNESRRARTENRAEHHAELEDTDQLRAIDRSRCVSGDTAGFDHDGVRGITRLCGNVDIRCGSCWSKTIPPSRRSWRKDCAKQASRSTTPATVSSRSSARSPSHTTP